MGGTSLPKPACDGAATRVQRADVQFNCFDPRAPRPIILTHVDACGRKHRTSATSLRCMACQGVLLTWALNITLRGVSWHLAFEHPFTPVSHVHELEVGLGQYFTLSTASVFEWCH